jgi:hypothetical protein
VNRQAHPVHRFLLSAFGLMGLGSSSAAAQIQDNSFLLEEAYNQERGIVQHIGTFARSDGGDWNLNLTQEWPLGGIRHQLSYTFALEHSSNGTGLGDLALNYRYQLLGNSQARTVVAPRLTLLLPTGSERAGRGAGALGFQVNLPLTINPSSVFATHWNAGVTLTPSAGGSNGFSATTFSRNLGGSLVWLVRPTFNVLIETVWLSDEIVVGPGATIHRESVLVSPGVRAAFNLAGGAQIVPGLAYTVGVTDDSAESGLFLYLSFEHPFTGQ